MQLCLHPPLLLKELQLFWFFHHLQQQNNFVGLAPLVDISQVRSFFLRQNLEIVLVKRVNSAVILIILGETVNNWKSVNTESWKLTGPDFYLGELFLINRPFSFELSPCFTLSLCCFSFLVVC